MRRLKRTLLVLGAAGALLLLVIGTCAVRLDRRLETPEAKAWLLEQARTALGVEVQAQTVRASLFSGVELRGVTVANPPGFPGPFLTAEALTLRHDLWPLLRGRLQVDELSVKRPVLSLAMDARGAFNYEKLGGGRFSTRRPVSGAPGTASGAARLMPLELAIVRLTVRDGRVGILDRRRAAVLSLEGADVDSSFGATATAMVGGGTARIATMGLGNVLFVREIKAPIEASTQRIHLGPIRGRLAGGMTSGDLDVSLGSSFRYKLTLEVEGAQVGKLLEEARSRSSLSGVLRARGAFDGEGGLATLRGEGQAEVKGCRARQAPLLVLLAGTLGVPELADPKLEDCRLEFRLGGGRARTPVVRLSGPDLRLTGRGTADLREGSLDYDMTLALSPALVGRIPIRGVRAAFQEGSDGFGALDFKVTGTMRAPRTDIALRLARAGAVGVVKDRLGKLLGREK